MATIYDRLKGGRAARKLRAAAGETIAETLVALLISALALVMLAGAIGSTWNMIKISDAKMGEYYERDAALVSQGTADGEMTVTITGSGAEEGEGISTTESRSVNYYANKAFGGKPVVAYRTKPAP